MTNTESLVRFAETCEWFREVYEDRELTALAGLVEAYLNSRPHLPGGMPEYFEAGLIELLRDERSKGEAAWYLFELRVNGILLDLEVRLSLTRDSEDEKRAHAYLQERYGEAEADGKPQLTAGPADTA